MAQQFQCSKNKNLRETPFMRSITSKLIRQMINMQRSQRAQQQAFTSGPGAKSTRNQTDAQTRNTDTVNAGILRMLPPPVVGQTQFCSSV